MKIRTSVFCGALLVAFVAGADARTYTTNFGLTEDPISEGGNWINGKAVGLDWANVATKPGLAYGREPGVINFDDSTAVLTGAWGPNQTVQATVHSANQSTTIIEEVELRVRTTISPHSITGYEINFRCLNTSSGYVQIVRWNGPLGSFTYLDSRPGGVKNGDVIKATIVGNVITAYVNNVQIFQVTDSTYTSGSPGIGFYIQGTTNTSVQLDYGLTSFSATDGLQSLTPPTNLHVVP